MEHSNVYDPHIMVSKYSIIILQLLYNLTDLKQIKSITLCS